MSAVRQFAEPISLHSRYVYGLHFSGFAEVTELGSAPSARPDASVITVTFSDAEPPAPVPIDIDGGVMVLTDGRFLSLDRPSRTATFFGPRPTTDLLAHPYLGYIAGVVNRWGGREVFHAGAFMMAGRAWAVLGERTAGKSTVMAAMAERHQPVLTDDILILDGTTAFAGPRCVDLRDPLPGSLPPTRTVRNGTRLRMALPPIEPQVRLGGWIFLNWGDRTGLTPISPADLLGKLAALRPWPHLPTSPLDLLALATLPAWNLTRPREWSAIDPVHELLTRTLSDAR